MGPKTKVFDIWGNSLPTARLNFAPASPTPVAAQYFSDFLPAKAKKSSGKATPEPELPESPEPPVETPPRLQVWKSAVSKVRQNNPQSPETPPEIPEEDTPGTEQQPEKPFWKEWFILGPAVVFVMIAIGLAGFLFIFHRSLAPVYLGNIKVSPSQSDTQLQKQISSDISGYNLALKDTAGKVQKYPLAKTGITIDSGKSVALVKSQVGKDWLGRMMWWKPIKLELVTNIDKDVLQNFLHTSVIKPDQPYHNASLSIDGGKVTIVKESSGKGQTEANPYIDLPAKVASLDASPITLQKLTIPAPIRASDLSDEKTKLESILNQKIVLHIDSATITPSPTDIAAWLDISPVEHSRTIDISVNSGRVQSYLDKIARPYVQPPRSRLTMTEADGSVTVLDYGANGIDIVNKDKTAADIAQKVTSAKGLDQKLDISYAEAKSVEVKPYDKWIVVDTTTKRMYAYEQSTMVHSFLVSAGAPKTPTVLGQYAIYAKFESQDMRGSNADGSRYFQPAVPWVNYFYKDYAIHGNYWRPASWFGNINSSHGCVGVMDDDAKWIYDWAPIGTPVIVHQ